MASAALLLGALLVMLLAMAMADRGWLDRPIERWVSRALGRDVRFDMIHTDLLSSTPRVRIDGLRIGNPAWLGGGAVAQIRSLTVELRFSALLRGSFEMTGLAVDRPVLHLVRMGPNRNNWSLSSRPHPGPAFAPLATVRTLVVTNGILQFRDYARHLAVRGPFDVSAGPTAFHFSGTGVLRDGAIQVMAAGGPLHGASVGRAYPFAARIVDGATVLVARGTSIQPFDLSQYHLAISSRGPNLADLGYLFNLVTPNSAPYRLDTAASSDGRHLRFDTLRITTGSSAVSGSIRSDHTTPRRDIFALFHASRLDRADIDAMLMPIPSRALARIRSGAVGALAPGRWLLSDAPFGLQRIRATDLDFRIVADVITGYPVPLGRVRTRIDLDHGLLDVPSFRADIYGGEATGRMRVDARADTPQLSASGRLAGMRMTAIGGTGTADLHFDLSGHGNSLHRAATTAKGSIAGTIRGATLPKSAGWIVGGDLVRAAVTTIGGGVVPLTCAAGDFAGQEGRMTARMLSLATPMGFATGQGYLDLGGEQLDIVITGTPSHRRMFQVAVPVRVSGPWFHPVVTTLPGRKAKALGLDGKLGVLLTPLAGLLPIKRAATPASPCK